MTINNPPLVAVAGATGYLGKHLVRALAARGYPVRALVRPGKSYSIEGVECLEVDVTQADSLVGAFEGVTAVFSALGITRQTDHVSYEDIEFTANLNVAHAAESSGVKRFGVISAVNPQLFSGLAIMQSRERFIEQLKGMGFTTAIVRATGFFSDLKEVFEMANRGRVFLLGSGHQRVNPIHGADLAEFCIDAWLNSPEGSSKEYEAGGPDILSWNEIADAAFRALEKPPRVTRLPLGLVSFFLFFVQAFSRRSYDVGQFLCRGASSDMVGPCSGERHLRDFYQELAKASDTERSA